MIYRARHYLDDDVKLEHLRRTADRDALTEHRQAERAVDYARTSFGCDLWDRSPHGVSRCVTCASVRQQVDAPDLLTIALGDKARVLIVRRRNVLDHGPDPLAGRRRDGGVLRREAVAARGGSKGET